jgi:ketosteroid isomerase-like protein
MTLMQRVPLVAGALLLAASFANGQQFAPLTEWKSAVMAGDKAALARLYSTNPPAVAQVGKDRVGNLADEWGFLAGLKSSGVTGFNPKVLDIVKLPERTSVVLRIQAVKAGQAVVAGMAQVWSRQADGWRIIATQRSEFSPAVTRRLPEPATPNTNL